MASILSSLGFGSVPLVKQVTGTYVLLRLSLAALSFALPVYLALGGHLIERRWQDSISAYYHAGGGALRDELVGALCAVGSLLLVYKGFSKYEDWALNIAGVSLMGVALFPSRPPCEALCSATVNPHGVFAVSFFASIAYVAFFRSSDTLPPSLVGASTATGHRRRYRLLSLGMAVAVGTALALAFAVPGSSIFFAETAGVWAFGAYWLLKTFEIARSEADTLASSNQLRARTYEGWKFFHPVPLDVCRSRE